MDSGVDANPPYNPDANAPLPVFAVIVQLKICALKPAYTPPTGP
jgi:hypothetical protein